MLSSVNILFLWDLALFYEIFLSLKMLIVCLYIYILRYVCVIHIFLCVTLALEHDYFFRVSFFCFCWCGCYLSFMLEVISILWWSLIHLHLRLKEKMLMYTLHIDMVAYWCVSGRGESSNFLFAGKSWLPAF